MLTWHLPVIDSALQRVQVLLIATHIGEFDVEIRQYREEKDQTRKADK